MIAARLSPGAISESNSSHLPASAGSEAAKPVTFPPGWLSRGTMPLWPQPAVPTVSLGDCSRNKKRAVDDLNAIIAHYVARYCNDPLYILCIL